MVNASPMIVPKWSKLSSEKQEEIINFAKDNSINSAAIKYHEEAKMSKQGLSLRLTEIFREKGYKSEHRGTINKRFGIRSFKRKAAKLTDDEKDLLKRLGNGTATFDEVSRVVAMKVFEKMLKYPDDFKFYDFYQTKLLEIKQQEVDDRNTWAMEIINRFFMGKLPPNKCPNCGTTIYEIGEGTHPAEHLIEGEIVQNGSKLTSRKV